MRFLVCFRGIHNAFREAELITVVARLRGVPEAEAAAALRIAPALHMLPGIDARYHRTTACVVLYGDIFVYVELNDVDEARQVGEQCMLIRAVLLVVAHGRDYHECVEQSLMYVSTQGGEDDYELAEVKEGEEGVELRRTPSAEAIEACRDMVATESTVSFKCCVEAFGRKYLMSEQLEKMERFHAIFETFHGPVRLKAPDVEFWIVEDAFPDGGHNNDAAETHEFEPRQVFFGRKIASGGAHFGNYYSLKRRAYIGPTSMDAELAFVAANFAHIKPGALVLDPFCGTGSILVSCARLGAHVIGADLNLSVLRGKMDGVNIESNFDQYSLPRPLGILRADLLHSPFRRSHPFLDAIVADPPYAIKEGIRTLRMPSAAKELFGGKPRYEGSVPAMERVRLIDLLAGLVQFSADMLVPGGRLVYWLPTTTQYTPADVPKNPAFRIISDCEQQLTLRFCRRLIVCVRVTPEEEKDAFAEAAAAAAAAEPDAVKAAARASVAHDDIGAKIMRCSIRSDSNLRRLHTPSSAAMAMQPP
jgi:tRNA (guanine10-N2)-methyltransferase